MSWFGVKLQWIIRRESWHHIIKWYVIWVAYIWTSCQPYKRTSSLLTEVIQISVNQLQSSVMSRKGHEVFITTFSTCSHHNREGTFYIFRSTTIFRSIRKTWKYSHICWFVFNHLFLIIVFSIHWKYLGGGGGTSTRLVTFQRWHIDGHYTKCIIYFIYFYISVHIQTHI